MQIGYLVALSKDVYSIKNVCVSLVLKSLINIKNVSDVLFVCMGIEFYYKFEDEKSKRKIRFR